jgi:hypothetical protein
MFLGPDLLPFLVLALGGAMFAGNALAILRPRDADSQEGELERAPLGRSLMMAAMGLAAAVWAVATLTS